MTRLPKKRGITQVGEDKSLILRQINSLKLVTVSSYQLKTLTPIYQVTC